MTTQAGVKKSTGARRGPSRVSKKDPWGEEQLTTSTKSRIIDVDLVKLLASPKAWTCLDEDEKREIIALLPDELQRHADPGPNAEDSNNYVIPPLPESFVRYSNSWRDSVRQFQLDLQGGRYDPEWQRQAAEAMEERAQGKFDKFKEEQFEEFWGQKQKLDHDVIAGESSKVKLGTLVENGVVRVGDVWRYSRVFRRRDEKLLLEKEVRIVDRDGSTLTFAIPPGQRVFLYNASHLANGLEASKSADPDTEAEAINIEANEVNNGTSSPNQVPQEDKVDIKAASVTSSVFLAKTTNPPPDRVGTNGNATLTIDAKPVVPDNQSATEYIQSAAPVSTDAPIQYSTTTAEPESMNVYNLECHIMLPGIAEMASADSDSELSSAIDMSSPSYCRNEGSKFPGTAATDIGTADSVPMVEAVLMGTTLNETPNHRRSSHPPSVVPMAVDAVDSDTQARVNNAQANGSKEPALSGSQSSEKAAANGSTAEAETTAAPTNGPAPATTPEPKSEQTQETILKDIIFSGVTGPGRLANKILEIDGRITEPPNGNAWKEFRCFRDNQDMGSLWECRQTWFVRQK
ncbi:hypothetical protein EMCG_07713 [[Emmonsia] crescens]|uniref:DEUBAD domain-containing protein n=1 Tax=[Emmonsia] crescens TaxID=73230 RepID=A0A0G2J5B6_9EURO|nr:hypothetical protein EMCG_07713 [Emmonsia crescens UAMH 3008]